MFLIFNYQEKSWLHWSRIRYLFRWVLLDDISDTDPSWGTMKAPIFHCILFLTVLEEILQAKGLTPFRGFWMAQYEDEFPAQVWVSGHLQTLIWSIGHLWLKVWMCPTLSRQPICMKYLDQNNNTLGVGHLLTLSRRCPMFWIKVQRCSETLPRAGNSSSIWIV